jgi:hypothetical protein
VDVVEVVPVVNVVERDGHVRERVDVLGGEIRRFGRVERVDEERRPAADAISQAVEDLVPRRVLKVSERGFN